MKEKHVISIIGLGYVGLIVATSFSKISNVIGYDIDETRVNELRLGHDKNNEVSSADLLNKNLCFTNNTGDISKANFHIITVPTPLNDDKIPNLTILLNSTAMLANHLKQNDIIVYESSTYPGATEEQCIPLLEKISNLKCGQNFFVGFSPERINPSDKKHTFTNIVKIVAATDIKTRDIIANVYSEVVAAGVLQVSSIRIAEACKVVENTQRDVNISFINDIAMMMHSLNIDMHEVIEAMKTKWNFLDFQPGLVGGHCIGINSYYLMYKSEKMGYQSDLILASRKVNESVANFIVYETIQQLINLQINIKNARIAVLGLTYKENCNDIRDTRVINIIHGLLSHDTKVFVHDPIADKYATKITYNLDLIHFDKLNTLDAIIIAVSHKQYMELKKEDFLQKLKAHGLIMDIKGILNQDIFSDTNITIWRL